MYDDEATVPTLPMIVDAATGENPFVSSSVPRLVVHVWPRPDCDLEGFLPVVHPLLNHQYSHPRDTICILADYQLLLSRHEQVSHADLIFDTASSLLALGVDPRNTLLCRESDIAPLTEVYWLLSCMLHLPTPLEVTLSPDSRRPDSGSPEHSLFLAAIAIGLGATRVVLNSESSGLNPSFVPLLREIERRLQRETNPIQVFEPPVPRWSPTPELAPDVRSADERYRSLRHNLAFLRDVLHEGALVASRIVHPAITGLRQHLHLNDRSEGYS